MKYFKSAIVFILATSFFFINSLPLQTKSTNGNNTASATVGNLTVGVGGSVVPDLLAGVTSRSATAKLYGVLNGLVTSTLYGVAGGTAKTKLGGDTGRAEVDGVTSRATTTEVSGLTSRATTTEVSGLTSRATTTEVGRVTSRATSTEVGGVSSTNRETTTEVGGVTSRATTTEVGRVTSRATTAEVAGVTSTNRETTTEVGGVTSRATIAKVGGVASRATTTEVGKVTSRATTAEVGRVTSRATTAEVVGVTSSATTAEVGRVTSRATTGKVGGVASRANTEEVGGVISRATTAEVDGETSRGTKTGVGGETSRAAIAEVGGVTSGATTTEVVEATGGATTAEVAPVTGEAATDKVDDHNDGATIAGMGGSTGETVKSKLAEVTGVGTITDSDGITKGPVIAALLGVPGGINGTGFFGNSSKYLQAKPRLERVVCNYDASAENRTDPANFSLDLLEVKYCTDVYYDFARLDSFPVDEDVQLRYWPFNSFEPTPRYATLNHHKLTKPELVSFVIVAEDGAGRETQGNTSTVPGREAERPGVRPGLNFSVLVENEDLMLTFSNWAVFLLRLWGFDGLAVRWPPTAGPERLQKLLILLNSRFNEEFRSSKRGMRGQLERLKIAVLMDMNRGDWLRIYDMNSISSIVDQVTLEPVPSTSDQDGNVTRITQPLHSMTSAQSGPGVPAGVRLSIDEAIQMVVSSGVIRSKVNVAISLTGVEFRLKDPTNHSIGAETIGLTGPSRIFYFDMCSFINHAQLSRASSSDKSPYWYSGDRWVSGEDEESIAQKIEYLKRKSIGGVALFSQSEDDFSGKFCNRGKFPLSFKVFEDSNINSNRRLLLPWQRYCSGQSPLRVKARWCLGLHTVVTMVVVLWGCMPW